ncbi:hypothetical protein, partial [Geobacillus stearothermophilus]|uniref:hypothetical protein n=1 Tax=Geobacillus stearothermophilus TaxID=1422 RepID=UPI001F238D61
RAARLRLFCAAYLSISFARSATSATVSPVRFVVSGIRNIILGGSDNKECLFRFDRLCGLPLATGKIEK